MRLFRGFSPRDFSGVFSIQYIINFARRISETVIGGAGGAQRPVFRVKDPKKTTAQNTVEITFLASVFVQTF